jgi:hypothetical protein
MIIIGAGIYGSLIALKLAKNGYDVNLYDKSYILGGSTKYNMWRIHNGYQYPNKQCMIRSSESYKQFIDMFPSAITKTQTYYMIATESKLSATQYIKYLDANSLSYSPANEHVVSLLKNYQLIDNVPAVYAVDEMSYDPIILQKLVMEQIMNEKRITFINQEYNISSDHNDIIINTVPVAETTCYEIIYGYLPEKYKDVCIVVMDGPFMTINSYGNTGMHAIYHVTYSHTDVPECDINKDIATSVHSHYSQIIKSCNDYFTDFNFIYVGSTFTKKLSNPACPECRHGYIKQENNVINCFPGKVGEALYISGSVVKKVNDMIIASQGTNKVS